MKLYNFLDVNRSFVGSDLKSGAKSSSIPLDMQGISLAQYSLALSVLFMVRFSLCNPIKPIPIWQMFMISSNSLPCLIPWKITYCERLSCSVKLFKCLISRPSPTMRK